MNRNVVAASIRAQEDAARLAASERAEFTSALVSKTTELLDQAFDVGTVIQWRDREDRPHTAVVAENGKWLYKGAHYNHSALAQVIGVGDVFLAFRWVELESAG